MSNFKKIQIEKDSNGNVKKTETSYSVRRDPQNYFILYVDGLEDVLLNITSANEIKVFLALCTFTKFNENIVSINKAVKEKIAAMISSTYGSVSNALSNLCKMGYLSNKGGNYTISYHLFWKGDTKTRQTLITNTVKKSDALKNAGSDFLENVVPAEDMEPLDKRKITLNC